METKPVRVPHGFYAGRSSKVHLGVERRGDVVILRCGMRGVAFGDGRKWLFATDDPVSCRNCAKGAK